MTSRFAPVHLVIGTALVLALAGCGAPLSENWSGYKHTVVPPENGGSAPVGSANLQPNQEPGSGTAPARVAPDCSAVKCVALTFDDGPGIYTPELLKILDDYDAKATFFLIGENVAKHPQTVKDEVAAGHEIGNHTWSHKDLTKMSVSAAQRDLKKTDDAIEKAIGEKPTLVRPPFGAIPPSLKKALAVPIALWNVDTLDWKTRDTKKTIKNAEQTTPGSIVLMHDIHESTIKAVPSILKDLKAQDYHFVTVTELIGHPNPGIGYGMGQYPGKK